MPKPCCLLRLASPKPPWPQPRRVRPLLLGAGARRYARSQLWHIGTYVTVRDLPWVCGFPPPAVGPCFRRNLVSCRPKLQQKKTRLPDPNPKPPPGWVWCRDRVVRRKSTSGASATGPVSRRVTSAPSHRADEPPGPQAPGKKARLVRTGSKGFPRRTT